MKITCFSISENQSLQFRRSIYAIPDIKKGEKFTKENLRVIRPGFVIQPIYFEKLINKRSSFDIKRETPLKKLLQKKFKILATIHWICATAYFSC